MRNLYQKYLRSWVHKRRQQALERRTVQEIREIAQILYQNGCVWSLQSGNALGIYRDGGFIKNEEDVDIAVLAETWHAGIEQEIRQKGYQVSMYCGGYEVGSEGVHITFQKRGMIFDLYPTFKDTWDGVSYRWYGGDYASRYYFEPRLLEETRTVDFYGSDIEIPADTDAYLRAIYGDDYMIPNPKWDWRTEPKCRLPLCPTYLTQAALDCYSRQMQSDGMEQ